ncbi:MAG: hypothetical protein WA532_15010 [Candidatus Korobacteraceae bacterium]
MKAVLLGLGVCALSSVMAGASMTIPAGTVVPVRLSAALNARHCQPGQTVKATVAQDVPLYNGGTIRAGSAVLGEVVSATPAENSQPASIVFRFDRIVSYGEEVPLSAHLRVLASPDEVQAAEVSYNPNVEKEHFDLTTAQIGGDDVVYRGGGPVADGTEIVGKPIEGSSADLGVLSHVAAYPGEPCHGPLAGNDHPRALWLFSHDACGVYGYDFTEGRIVLESEHGNMRVDRGSALLLRVNAVGGEGSQR